MQYRGGSLVKAETRRLLHTHIQSITSPPGILIFLAGSEGEDILVARQLGMRDNELVGVERDLSAYKKVVYLYDTIRIYREDVAFVVDKLTVKHIPIRSVILDYCGCWTSDNETTTKKVVSCLKPGAHFSVTLLRARDANMIDDHRVFVDSILQSLHSVQKQITHTQTIIYQSRRESDGSNGSPMITMSFLIGKQRIKPEVIDLR